MRVVITGADGQLGMALQSTLTGHHLIPLTRPSFDLLQPSSIDQIVAAAPQVVIHAAAFTNVDGAEREPDVAMKINAEGTERVAKAAARVGARLIVISTDYVFDGNKTQPYKEEDLPNPLNAYGRSKLAGERAALEGNPDTLIVRTAWLYGAHGKNFVKTILRAALEKPELKVVNDQQGSPTNAEDLASALAFLLSSDMKGIVHAVNGGHCTWFEFASVIVELAGLHTPVRPITTQELASQTVRPKCSVLSCQKLETNGFVMPAWRTSLERFVQKELATCR
jgi:dTDP-4-dehydrorhamnose reductase